LPLTAHVQLVLEKKFKKFGVAEAVGCGFLQAHVEGLRQS